MSGRRFLWGQDLKANAFRASIPTMRQLVRYCSPESKKALHWYCFVITLTICAFKALATCADQGMAGFASVDKMSSVSDLLPGQLHFPCGVCCARAHSRNSPNGSNLLSGVSL
jgi:hypothetical protein